MGHHCFTFSVVGFSFRRMTECLIYKEFSTEYAFGCTCHLFWVCSVAVNGLPLDQDSMHLRIYLLRGQSSLPLKIILLFVEKKSRLLVVKLGYKLGNICLWDKWINFQWRCITVLKMKHRLIVSKPFYRWTLSLVYAQIWNRIRRDQTKQNKTKTMSVLMYNLVPPFTYYHKTSVCKYAI